MEALVSSKTPKYRRQNRGEDTATNSITSTTISRHRIRHQHQKASPKLDEKMVEDFRAAAAAARRQAYDILRNKDLSWEVHMYLRRWMEIP